jgi:hypothetical protein
MIYPSTVCLANQMEDVQRLRPSKPGSLSKGNRSALPVPDESSRRATQSTRG